MKNALIALATLAFVTGAVAQTGRAEFEARLTGQGKGKAKWKTRDSQSQFQAELEVEGENLARNQMYKVQILTNTWNVMTNGFGAFHFGRTYRTANRPNITAGTVVKLLRADATTAQSGAFVRTR